MKAVMGATWLVVGGQGIVLGSLMDGVMAMGQVALGVVAAVMGVLILRSNDRMWR